MQKLFAIVKSMASLVTAFFKWFHATTIAPADEGKRVPPIRYDGDPKDIYLA